MNQATGVVLSFLSTVESLETINRPTHELLDQYLGPVKKTGLTLVDRALIVFRDQVNEARVEFEVGTRKFTEALKSRDLTFCRERLISRRDEQDTRFLIQVLPDVLLEYRRRFGSDSLLRAWESPSFDHPPDCPRAVFSDDIVCGPDGTLDFISYLLKNQPTDLSLARVCAITGGRHELTPPFEIIKELFTLNYPLLA